MIRMKKLFATLSILLTALYAGAQEGGNVPVSDQFTGLRASGKIYVVLAVAVTILTGLIVYLIRLDRKITKLEKNI